jgi:hypothetical protein
LPPGPTVQEAWNTLRLPLKEQRQIPLRFTELHFILERQWRKLGRTLDPEDFTDFQAIAADAQVTGGISASPTGSSPRSDRS